MSAIFARHGSYALRGRLRATALSRSGQAAGLMFRFWLKKFFGS